VKRITHIILFILMSLFISSCDKSVDSVNNKTNEFQFLEINYLFATGASNLMPPVPLDPIGISATFIFHNVSSMQTIKDIFVKDAQVFNAASDTLIGNISMYFYPEIFINPSEKDTITFYKETQKFKLFDPPCRDSIFLKINLKDKYDNYFALKTSNFLYECSY